MKTVSIIEVTRGWGAVREWGVNVQWVQSLFGMMEKFWK